MLEYEGDGVARTADGTPYEPLSDRKPGPDCLEFTENGRTARLVDPRTHKTKGLKFLWHPYLRKGGLNVLVGPGGSRKSTTAAFISAQATLGRLTDDNGESCGKQRVLYVEQGEDEMDSVLIPRITAQGADLDLFRIFQITTTGPGGTEVPATTSAKDLDLIRRMVREFKPGLVVLDPLALLVKGDINSFEDVQPALVACNEISQIGDGCAVLGLHHWNKGGTFTGSQKFEDTARSFLEIIPDPDDDTASILSVKKANNSAKPSIRLTAKLLPFKADDGTTTTVQIIDHVEASDISVDMLRGAVTGGDSIEDMGEIDRWLLRFMQSNGGKVSYREIMEFAAKAHYSKDQVKNAKKRLRIQSRKDGEFQGVWYWSLPSLKETQK